MAKINSDAADEYLAMLKKLEKNTDDICKQTVYQGAKVVADAIKQSIDALPVQPPPTGKKFYYLSDAAKKADELIHGISEQQKEGLQKGFGITDMQQENGGWNVKIGFVGYNEVKTKKYPKGQPNAMIARSVESGSSVRDKTPFIAPAVRTARKSAEKAMEITISEKIQALLED